MKTLTNILLTIIFTSTPLMAEDIVKQFMESEVYSIDTISLASGTKAQWIIFKNGKYDVGSSDAAGVLKHFAKQPEEKKEHGIFIHSKTHSIPLTDEEMKWMTPYLLELHQKKEWRESENALVNKLVEACNKRGIPVWVNISSNINGKWKLLTDKLNKSEQLSEPRKLGSAYLDVVR